MTLGEKILQNRKRLQLSQEQLGQMLFVSRQTVSFWETNQTAPTVDNLIALKKVFGISLDELLSADEAPLAAKPAPLECYSLTYTAAEIKKLHRALWRKRLLLPIILACLFLFSLIANQANSDPAIMRPALGSYILCVVFAALLVWRISRNGWKRSVANTADTVYTFRVFEDELQLILARHERQVAVLTIPFSEISGYKLLDEYLLLYWRNGYYILRRRELPADSRVYRFVNTKIAEKKVNRAPAKYRVWTTILCIASIAGLLVSLIIAAIVTGESMHFYRNMWITLLFGAIPLALILLGYRMRALGYPHRVHMIIGYIMLVLHLIYGTMFLYV